MSSRTNYYQGMLCEVIVNEIFKIKGLSWSLCWLGRKDAVSLLLKKSAELFGGTRLSSKVEQNFIWEACWHLKLLNWDWPRHNLSNFCIFLFFLFLHFFTLFNHLNCGFGYLFLSLYEDNYYLSLKRITKTAASPIPMSISPPITKFILLFVPTPPFYMSTLSILSMFLNIELLN